MQAYQEVDLDQLAQINRLGGAFDYADHVNLLLGDVIPIWQNRGLISFAGTYSWGGFISNPAYAGRYAEAPDDPYELVGLIFGYGGSWREYALNAVRKGRWLARYAPHFTSTLDMKGIEPDHPVESAASKHDRRWGDFGHGGVVLLGEGPEQRMWGFSAWDAEEDDVIARLAGVTARTTRRRQLAPH